MGEALTAIGVREIGDLELAPPSSNTLVFKCGGLFYRFATNRWQARRMPRERVLLERIGPRLSLKVPEIVRSSNRPVFNAYRVIEGVGLDQAGYMHFEPAQRQRVLIALARFLVELHQLDTTWCESTDWDVGWHISEIATDAALDHYGAVDPGGSVRRFAEQTVEAFAAHRRDGPTAVLLHDDFADNNVLVNPLSGEVTGIVDFTDWRIGDHHRDFSRLRLFGGDDALRNVARLYTEECGRPVNFEIVTAMERAHLCRILLRLKRPPKMRVDRIVGMMRSWRPMA